MNFKLFAIFAVFCFSSSQSVYSSDVSSGGIVENLFNVLKPNFPDMIKVQKKFPKKLGLKIVNNKTQKIEEKIVFGHYAAPGQFPFVGLMLVYLGGANTGLRALCTCSLITPTFTIHAAHCIDFALLGTQFFFGSIDSLNFPTVVNGIAYAKHPFFNFIPGSYMNDIAVFQLQKSVTLSANVQLVKLPSRLSSIFNYQDDTVTTIGFGTDETGQLSRYFNFSLRFELLIGMII